MKAKKKKVKKLFKKADNIVFRSNRKENVKVKKHKLSGR